jgi:4-amino-4-deoxy-L-arabinose transferase-like glycosyltransferase
MSIPDQVIARRHRVELGAVLLATAALYLWNLGASGWANPFYSAAAQAGSQNWTAWFFGSSDAANSITVDKPPASLWIMGLSVRLFGLNAWSILVPEAMMGVATAWILYLAVRSAAIPASGKVLAHRAGLLAAAVLAVTPVATLMFRFNNPDALLVLLMTAAAYGVVRSIQENRLRWLLLAGAFIGFGFLAKQLQVLLVVPGFAFAYLLAARPGLGRRLLHLLAAGAAVVLSAGWWLAAVELTPAAQRPYIGGSQNNSILELTLGYNGFGRLNGSETGSVGGSNGWGAPGLFRMFSSEFGGQIAWLIPSALLLGAGLLWIRRRTPRTDGIRASVLVWASWVLVTGLTFSFMAGIIHPYYAVALAPGIAGLTGLGAALLWERRSETLAAVSLAAAVTAAGLLAWYLLGQTPTFLPWLRWLGLALSLLAAALVAVVSRVGLKGPLYATAALAVAASLAGPLAYSLSTAATAHTGAIVSAGPSAAAFVRAGQQGGGLGRAPFAGLQQKAPPNLRPNRQGGGRQGAAGMGGLLGATTPSAEMVTALKAGADRYRWAAAVVGSNNAAGYQLATGLPVMAVGGFNGTDPSPTVEQFRQLVAEGKIHYFIASQIMGGDSGSEAATEIAAWVKSTFPTSMVGGTTVYDLSQ